MKQTKERVSEIKVSYKPKLIEGPKITSSNVAYNFIKRFYSKDTIALQEKFVVLYLNRANQAIGVYQGFSGGITGTIIDLRIIMGIALKSMACGIFLCHNHPSGNLLPSTADVEITKKIKEACKLMDISLIDHLIISPEGDYFSFMDEGKL
jgi:DNA repair protein RadC